MNADSRRWKKGYEGDGYELIGNGAMNQLLSCLSSAFILSICGYEMKPIYQ
jgi:hypothetical protein